MYERILVPIDGGVTAAQGLKEAMKIAQYHGSLIHLVHIVDELPVIEPFGGTGGSEFVMAQLRDIGKSLLDSCTAEVRDCGIPLLAGRRACEVAVPPQPQRCNGSPPLPNRAAAPDWASYR